MPLAQQIWYMYREVIVEIELASVKSDSEVPCYIGCLQMVFANGPIGILRGLPTDGFFYPPYMQDNYGVRSIIQYYSTK